MTRKERIREISKLYLLMPIVISVIEDHEERLKSIKSLEEDNDKVQELLPVLLENKQRLVSIDKKLKELKEGFLIFSIEELYDQFGRYDKSIKIDFHFKSDSATKYGGNIMGVLKYNRRNREDLNKIISSGVAQRTNGLVKIIPSKRNKLDKDQINGLQNEGFMAGDIFKISIFNSEVKDEYANTNKKEIPGTINVKFDSSGIDPDFFSFKLLEKRIADKNGKPLIKAEWEKYYALKLIYDLPNVDLKKGKEHIFESGSNKMKDTIQYQILLNKIKRKIPFLDDEKLDFGILMRKRASQSNRLVDKEINKSKNTKLRTIIEENKEVVAAIRRISFNYETLNLSSYGAKYPVFLDLERFLHIFIRHLDTLQVGDWKDGRSKIQYGYRDSIRLIRIIVKELQPKIDEALLKGKEFRIFDLKAHYYNGNYYVVHIDKKGRFLSFYPLENK